MVVMVVAVSACNIGRSALRARGDLLCTVVLAIDRLVRPAHRPNAACAIVWRVSGAHDAIWWR
eukprot:1493108-Prymnesium_polylepis.1